MNRAILLLLGVTGGFLLALGAIRMGLLDDAGVAAPGADGRRAAADERLHDGARDDGDEDDGDGDDGDDDDVPERVVAVAGRRYVRLEADEQALAGVVSERLAAMTTSPERQVVGIVADDLVLAAQQAALARARERRAAQAATLAVVRERLAGLRALGDRGQLGAAREIAELELAVRREHERTLQLDERVAQAEQALLTQWGGDLVRQTTAGSALATALAAGETALVTFALAAGGEPPPEVHVGVDGVREQAQAARVVAAAQAVLAGSNRATWHAVVEAPGLRHGMHVDVWVPRAHEALTGALLPDDAVVWHGGRRWYFVARDAALFERVALPAQPPGLSAAFLPASQAEDVRVVTRGAQTLLAEEFRGAIPDEDDD